MSDTEPAYVVYVDEAGDPGINSRAEVDPCHQWFTASAVVLRPEIEPEVVDWIKVATEGVKGRQSPVLHYRNLTPGAKLHVCQHLGRQRMRGFVVASHKANMRSYKNPRLTSEQRGQRFYNWCLRVLLERVTQWCVSQAIEDFGEPRPAHLIFSERGGHLYGELFDYLFTKVRWQEEAQRLVLPHPVIRGVLSRDRCEVVKHERRAGLQLADVLASAFLQGANSALSSFDLAPAKALSRVMARPRPKASKANFGVTLLPLKADERTAIPEDDRGLFRFYGYKF